jgi:hypothetical protein
MLKVGLIRPGRSWKMNVLNVGMGFMLLLAGRPFYTVFTAVIGYLIGRYVSQNYAIAPASWNELILPMIFAVIGAALAYVLRRWAVRLAGVVAGIYVVATMPEALGGNPAWAGSLIVMGLVGLLFALALIFWFDYSLIFISSLTASTLVLASIHSGALAPPVMLTILMIFGVLVQFLLMQYGRSLPD